MIFTCERLGPVRASSSMAFHLTPGEKTGEHTKLCEVREQVPYCGFNLSFSHLQQRVLTNIPSLHYHIDTVRNSTSLADDPQPLRSLTSFPISMFSFSLRIGMKSSPCVFKLSVSSPRP